MKISTLSIGLLALFTPITAAWSKEDREIFRVRDELIAHEGPDVTFYQFLGISPSASLDDINKAYRKKSRALHPDKVKQQLQAERAAANKKNKASGKPAAKPATAAEVKAAVKRASERQARLSIVTNVLRGPDRDRYDHFLSHGFPTWKGTEYYYSRYRPGLGTVLVGVFLVAGGGAHYLALYMSWRRQREFVDRYIKYARNAAWGDNLGLPGVDAAAAAAAPPPQDDDDRRAAAAAAAPLNRKLRRMQERDAKKEAAKEAAAGSGRRGRRQQQQQQQQNASASNSGSATPVPLPPPPPGTGPTGAKKRVVAENGKVLVVDSLGDVYLEQEDEDGNRAEYLLDPNEIPAPTIRDTAVVRLPLFVYGATLGRLLSTRASSATEDGEDGEEVEEDADAADDEDSSGPDGKRTPSSTGSAEESSFEMLEKSTSAGEEDKEEASPPANNTAKASGAQRQGKAAKRKGKKR